MVEYRKVTLDYLSSAPGKICLEQELPVTPAELFEVFERSDSWQWAGISSVEWGSEPPFNAGTVRTIVQARGGRIEEQFLLWEQDRRMAFRLERGDVRLIGALLEDYSVVAIGQDRCRLTWTIAYELRGWLKLLQPLLAGVMHKQFSRMFDDLGAMLTR